MSPRARRVTTLDDNQHASKVIKLLNQRQDWLNHDDELEDIEEISPQHALSAYRKLIAYAQEGMLGGAKPVDVVVSPLGMALRMQAFGDAAVQAEIDTHSRTLSMKRKDLYPLRVSQVLAAVESIDDEVKRDEDNTLYTDPVDYAVRLTELINERLI